MTDPAAEVSLIARLLAADPAAAADRLDALAEQLGAQAAALRAQADGGWRSGGGAGDRVTIQVVGPDGRVKQTGGTEL